MLPKRCPGKKTAGRRRKALTYRVDQNDEEYYDDDEETDEDELALATEILLWNKYRTGKPSPQSSPLLHENQWRRSSSASTITEERTRLAGKWQRNYRRVSAHKDCYGQRPRRSEAQAPTAARRRSYAGPIKRRSPDITDSISDLCLSDVEGNEKIAQMNGLLDIWDAKNNPNWEEETFTLLGLDRCDKCGMFYVPLKTESHRCRRRHSR